MIVARPTGQEFVAEYPDRMSAAAARDELAAHGVPRDHLMLEPAGVSEDRLSQETLRRDRRVMYHVGRFALAGTLMGTVAGVALVAAVIGIASAIGAPLGISTGIALLLGATGGLEAGAFIGATASLPALPAINADLLLAAEPHVFIRVRPADEREAGAAMEALAATRPEHLRRLAGPVLASS